MNRAERIAEQRAQRAARVRRIERMRARGMTMAEIGELEGVSGARIQRLLSQPQPAASEPTPSALARAARNAEIVRASCAGATQQQIAEQHGIDRTRVSRILRAAREA